jgi:hypothetical protein|tara:strand:+ start:54 stop:956 length:903 start_codon:yes stop_codon:yes gene_type:complete
MSDRAAVKRGLTFPFPKDKASKDKAVEAHLSSRKAGGPMHYFVKDDGSIHYLDNKGNGYRFNDLATKLHNEAKRRGRKLDSTPTLDDYVEVFGSVNGTKLFETEQQRLREIYKNANTLINDVDHIDSLGQGGLHYSRNLRELLSSENRSDGARRITDEMRNALMLAQDKRDQIALQGPPVPPALLNLQELANRMANGNTPLAGAVSVADRVLNRTEIAKDLWTFGQNGEQIVEKVAGAQIQGQPVFEANYNGVMVGRNDPSTDIGKRTGDSISNGVNYATNQLSYIAKTIADGKLPYNGH